MKKQRGLFMVTVFATLLPLLIGIVLWSRLPEQIPVHWGIDGQADRFGAKLEAVVLWPVFLAVIQCVLILWICMDPGKKQMHPKPMAVTLWIIPAVSILVNGCTYIIALGGNIDITTVIYVMLGVLWILLGNYIPKLGQNYTVGIKVPWTLNSERNWTLTHRMAGRLFVAAGIISICAAFLESVVGDEVTLIVIVGVIIAAGLGSVLYSFWLYKYKGI